jgi:hypothetical protein
MTKKWNYYNNTLLLLFVIFFNISCAKIDPVTGEKVIIEPNPVKRAEASRDSSGGIFGNINKSGNNQTTVNFANTNVLWKASLKTLDFIPLQSVDYAGGILITDWYADEKNSGDFIKITIKFLDNEVRSNSLNIISHKKICSKGNDNCSVVKLSDNFNNEIKDTIIQTARLIKIEEEKKIKK